MLGIRASLLALLFAAVNARGAAQDVQLLRYIPGNYLSDNLHRVEIYNAGTSAADLSDWLLVTRDYAFRFPAGSRLYADRRLTIAKQPIEGRQVDVKLLKHPNFMIKLYSRRVEGNFCALLDSRRRLVDAFYFAALPNVPFLPDSGSCYLNNAPVSDCYRLPPEQSREWKYFSVGYDPAVGFEQHQGQWRLISARSTENLYPSAAFGDLTVRYRDGAVLLRCTTQFEDRLSGLILERSEDLQAFEPVSTLKTAGDSRQPQEYIIYDTTVKANRTYYYRIRTNDAPDLSVQTKIVEVETRRVPVEFRLDVQPQRTTDSRSVNVRFSSALTQDVLIKLLDENMRELAILHQGLVYAETLHLLRIEAKLPAGKYLILAATEAKRYSAALLVE